MYPLTTHSFAWVLLTQAEEFLHYSSHSLCSCSRGFSCAFATRCFSAAPDDRPDPAISTSGFLRSSSLASTTVEPLRSLSVCNRCCTSVSSSRCMSSSMRALHSSECGFVTLCAPAARVVQASHSGVGPYRATSCFRMYLRLCCGVLTIASGKGINHCRHWRWSHLRLFSDEHPRNSSASSDELTVPLLVCGFPLNSRTSQQSTF